MEGECYDYDADIDELFLLAAKIICPAGQEEVLNINFYGYRKLLVIKLQQLCKRF